MDDGWRITRYPRRGGAPLSWFDVKSGVRSPYVEGASDSDQNARSTAIALNNKFELTSFYVRAPQGLIPVRIEFYDLGNHDGY